MQVLDRNWRCEHGEIDLVALDGDCLVVCEVKTRRSTAFGEPVEAVTWRKAARLRRLAAAWLAAHDVRPDARADRRHRHPPARERSGRAAARPWGGLMSLGRTRSVALTGLDGCAGRRRGRHRPGAAALRRQRPAGYRVPAVDRPHQGRGRQQRGAAAAAAHHRQPFAGVDPQVRDGLRPADRGRGPRRGTGARPLAWPSEVVHLGELGLDGTDQAGARGAARVLAAAAQGARDVVVPLGNAAEAALVPGVRVHAMPDLADPVPALRHGQGWAPAPSSTCRLCRPATAARLRQGPRGRRRAARGPAGSRAGRSRGAPPVLMGPPGAGKTMLAERLVSVLPRLDRQQSLEVLAVRSLLGPLPDALTVRDRRPRSSRRTTAPPRRPSSAGAAE